MAKKESIITSKLNFERIIKILLIIGGIICLFTFFDLIVHSLSREYAVPDYYFKNKIIFGTIWAFFIYLILRRWKIVLLWKSLIFSGLVAAILQTRYYIEGYSNEFVFEFLLFHLLILWPISYIIFKVLKKEI